jgi:hypothetical protein
MPFSLNATQIDEESERQPIIVIDTKYLEHPEFPSLERITRFNIATPTYEEDIGHSTSVCYSLLQTVDEDDERFPVYLIEISNSSLLRNGGDEYPKLIEHLMRLPKGSIINLSLYKIPIVKVIQGTSFASPRVAGHFAKYVLENKERFLDNLEAALSHFITEEFVQDQDFSHVFGNGIHKEIVQEAFKTVSSSEGGNFLQ